MKEPNSTQSFIMGAEWVLKTLDSLEGDAGRIVSLHTYDIRKFIAQTKNGFDSTPPAMEERK